MTLSKIIGWLTFLAGIVIIGTTIYFTYNIFTGVSATPQVFSFESEPVGEEEEEVSGIEAELKKMLSEQLTNLIPLDSVTMFANLAAWTVGAWLLIFGGSKVSELGIKLISIPTNKELS